MCANFLCPNLLFGRIIRIPLRLIPPETQLRVIFGKNKGKKWIVGSGLHSYWIGCFEKTKQKMFSDYVSEGNVCIRYRS